MPTPEGVVLKAVLAFCSTVPGLRVFRNHSGRAVMKGKGGRKFSYKFGVGPSEGGGADLLGFYRQMHGYTWIARFVAIECKAPGGKTSPKLRALQEAFLEEVRQAGGIAGFVTSVDEAKALLGLDLHQGTEAGCS